MSLRDKGAITGAGETVYTRNSGQTVVALHVSSPTCGEQSPAIPTA
jgi:hypothetical protein